MTFYRLTAAGEPAPINNVEEWAAWFQTADRTLATDQIGDVRISTVFLGINHAWDGGPPVLWETMIFGGPKDGYQDRYRSRDEALAGHALAVAVAARSALRH